ncbi:MAG: UDP-N-acetylglucosamine 1-carboxyvinyltransferase [Chthoniobacterales bacterium]
MDKILVHGGQRLNGTVRISGSKNSALPILAASLLTREKCVIRAVPDLSDIHYMLTILSQLGCEVERASGVVSIKAESVRTVAPYELVRKMRASVCVLGPLLGREHEACVSLPGGCVIGDRPIDLHLRGFEALGAAVRVQEGNVKLLAPALRGATVSMRGSHGSTVLGTDNVMMAAVLAQGTTIIDGAAGEPEVVDLANFLISMGAKIEGAGTHHIVIEGVKELHGTDYTIIPDRIEAGTMLVAGAIGGGRVTVSRVRPDHLVAVIEPLQAAGYHVESTDTAVTISPNGATKPLHLETSPYPGFPTDMQAQMCALLVRAPGVSVITDHVFPQRFMHVAELSRMGAQIKLQHPTAIITGNGKLSGAPVMASDLRASAALLLAGLAADGVTEVNRVYHIDRGYERIDEKLNSLGAHIERVQA